MLRPDSGYSSFKSLRESFWFGFEFVPSMLELAFPSIVNILPVIVDDQVGDPNVALRQLIECIEDLFVGKPLAKGVPRAFK